MVHANTGFHADQARRHVREPCFDLAARPLLPQHDRATPVEADDVERVLPISMPIVATVRQGCQLKEHRHVRDRCRRFRQLARECART